LAQVLPRAELYGIDASQAMLTQAAGLLRGYPQVHLAQAVLTDEETAGLPYVPAFFDLILCTNTLHYFSHPVGTLRGLRHLLVPTGQMVIEDYALRGFPFPWRPFEWVIKVYDPQHRRLYTSAEAQALCQQANLQVIHTQTFQIDLFCQGWALLLRL
jgi:SAM-dependent methyltransferase